MIHDRSYEAWVEAEAEAIEEEQAWLALGAMRAEAEANAANKEANEDTEPMEYDPRV